MSIKNSELYGSIIESHSFEIGNLYLFENLAVSEINEGKHFSFETSFEFISVIADFYTNDKPFGYISNRINSFSIEALDFPTFIKTLTNLKIFSAITYGYYNTINLEIEKKFCSIPYKSFNNLKIAFNYLNDFVVKQKLEKA